MLPRSQRVRTDRDYQRIFRSSRPLRGPHLSLRRRPAAKTRFGFVISKKVTKKATVRNLIKRRMRHAVTLFPKNTTPFDAVFIAGPKIQTLSFNQLRDEMIQLWTSRSYAPPTNRRD